MKTIVGHQEVTSIPAMQVAVFIMCGGGLIGISAAERPADFYIDGRVSSKQLPYCKRKILQTVRTLIDIAEASDMNPHRLPQMPHLEVTL